MSNVYIYKNLFYKFDKQEKMISFRNSSSRGSRGIGDGSSEIIEIMLF